MDRIRKLAGEINITGKISLDEPMANHTTFKTGGAAALFLAPKNKEELLQVVRLFHERGERFFILGGGANILVADEGIRGVVVSMAEFAGVKWRGDRVEVGCGGMISDLAWETGSSGYSGLENFYAMPGSVGGAMWMNARCYGRSISDTLLEAELLQPDGTMVQRALDQSDFAYKRSPFQGSGEIIVSGLFQLTPASSTEMIGQMEEFAEDRRRKGHFDAPSGGSFFKNNREFGMPSGKLLELAGANGISIGGARVSPKHGNIVQNYNGSTSREIRNLVEHMQELVSRQFGYTLEREVMFIGEWPEGGDCGY